MTSWFRSCRKIWAKKKKKIDWKNQALTNQKVKSLIDFDEEYSGSIRSIAIEKSSKLNLTTRFLNREMFMFSKLSIKNFVYDLIDIFKFPKCLKKLKRFIKNIKLADVIFTKTWLIQIAHQCFLFLYAI